MFLIGLCSEEKSIGSMVSHHTEIQFDSMTGLFFITFYIDIGDHNGDLQSVLKLY